VLAVFLATGISDYVLKPIIHRPRPFLVVSGPAVIGHAPHDSSFPSGHAAAAVAGALTLARASPTGQFAWWLLAAGIAYSRVYLGVHYPSDVAGSVAIGAICGALVIAAIKRIQVPKHQAP
jgi:undecaprenyl-diphosphatase